MTTKTCFVDTAGYLMDYKTGATIRRATAAEDALSAANMPTGAFECDPDASAFSAVSVLLGRDGTGLNEDDFSAWISYADVALGRSLVSEIAAGLELEIESRGERDQLQTDHVSGSDPEMVETVRGALRDAWDAFCSEAS